MTKIAIVGNSLIYNHVEEVDVKLCCKKIIEKYDRDTIILSGGASGVDSIAVDVARTLGYKINEYVPETDDWAGYKPRNLRIANECDELHCIVIPKHIQLCYHHKIPEDHEKTAGCWTLAEAEKLDKKVTLHHV